MQNKGRLIVISGPSGVGKGTIIRQLLKECKNLGLSVSATTRAPRGEDAEGVTYFFKTKDQFKKMIESESFLEWAIYNDNYYGTPVQAVNDQLNQGIDVLLEIDVQGAINVMDKCPDGIFIFIAPPSVEVLHQRLVGRATESDEEIKNRVTAAEAELSMKDKYDYIVINDVLENAIQNIKDILERKD